MLNGIAYFFSVFKNVIVLIIISRSMTLFEIFISVYPSQPRTAEISSTNYCACTACSTLPSVIVLLIGIIYEVPAVRRSYRTSN